MRAQHLLQGFVASALFFQSGATKKSCKPRPSSQISQISTPAWSMSSVSTPIPSATDDSSSSIIVSPSDTPVSTPTSVSLSSSTPSEVVTPSSSAAVTPSSSEAVTPSTSEAVTPSATQSSIDTSALPNTPTPSTSILSALTSTSILTSTPTSTPTSTIESTSAISSSSTSISTSDPPPSTTSTLGPIVTQFALQGRDRDPPALYNGNSIVNGKPAQVRAGNIIYFNPPASTASQYSPGQFYLDTLNYLRVFGTDLYLVGNTQGNGVYSVATVVNGYFPLQCTGPVRQGQPLQCVAVGKGTNTFGVSTISGTGQLQLTLPGSASAVAIDLVAA